MTTEMLATFNRCRALALAASNRCSLASEIAALPPSLNRAWLKSCGRVPGVDAKPWWRPVPTAEQLVSLAASANGARRSLRTAARPAGLRRPASSR